MKGLPAELWITIASAVVMLGVWGFSAMPGRNTTVSLVSACTLESVQLEEVTVAEAAEYLENAIRESDHRLRGIRIVVPDEVAYSGREMPKISMQLEDVSASEALIYMAQQMGAWPHYSAGWIQMWPISTSEDQHAQGWLESYVTGRAVSR